MRRRKKIKIVIMLSFLMICALFVNILNPFNADTPKELDLLANGGKFEVKTTTNLLNIDWNAGVMFNFLFEAGNTAIKKGDYFTIAIPKELKWHQNAKPVALTAPDTNEVLANVSFEDATNTAKVEFTEEAENKINIKGLFVLYTKIAEKKVLEETDIQIVVGTQAVYTGKIKVKAPEPYKHTVGEYYYKNWGDQVTYNDKPALKFYVRVNKAKHDLKNITIEDEIVATSKVKIIPESFRLWKVEYLELPDKLDIKYDKESLLTSKNLFHDDVTKPYIQLNEAGTKFVLVIPNPGTQSYFLDYHVTNPLTGEHIKNIVSAREEDEKLLPYEGWDKGYIMERGTYARHYAYGLIQGDIKGKLVITKEDINGNPLEKIKFRVVSEDKSYDEEHWTDANGKIEIAGLKDGKYTISELEVSEIYEKPDDKVANYTVADGALVLFVNRPKLVDVAVHKKWEGGDAFEYNAEIALYQAVGTQEAKPALDDFKKPLVKKLDKGLADVTVTFEKLRKYNDAGELYIYSVRELNMPAGYTVEENKVNPANPYEINLKNVKKTAPVEETVDITVTKKWTGHFDVPTREVEFTLQRKLPADVDFQDVLDGGGNKITAKIPQGAADPKVVFEDYPKFQYVAGVKGELYTYRVLETPLTSEGYTTSYNIQQDGDGNYMIEVTNDRVLGMGGTGDPDPEPEDDGSSEGAGTVSKVERITPKPEPEKDEKKPETPKKEENPPKQDTENRPETKPKEEPGKGKTGETATVDKPTTEVQPGVIPIQNQGGNIGTTDTTKQPNTSVQPNKGMLPKTGEGLNVSDYFVILSLVGLSIIILGHSIKRKEM